MLVVTIKPNDRILISDGKEKIWVTASGPHHEFNQIKVAIDAPQHWKIIREELIDGSTERQ
jgi:sRNA-binding carbon storage regulator CsrA